MPVLTHIHTLERVVLNGDKRNTFRCTHPDCSFVGIKNLLQGKRALCSCGESFILTFEQLRRKRPHCEKCFNSERGERAKLAATFSEVLGEK